MQIKIGDFGLSTKVKNNRQRKYTTCGTPNYIAPEILNQTGHSFQVDIWAVGVILYTLLIGKPPFQADTVDNTYTKIKNTLFQFPKQIPLSNQIKNLIIRLLQPNPKYRISINQIRNHQFLSKNVIKLPLSMPSYTISIPPQNSYLKQYISQKHLKLSIFPRKISNTSELQTQRQNQFDQNNNKKQKNKKLYNDNNKQIDANNKQIDVNNKQIDVNNKKYKKYKNDKMIRVLSLDKQLLKKQIKSTHLHSNIYNDNIHININNNNNHTDQHSTLNRGYIKNKVNSINNQHNRHNKLKHSLSNSMINSLCNNKKNINININMNKNIDICEIVCYLDLQQKYGIGYLLSNGNYGMIFNDKTTLTKLQIQSKYIYYDNTKTQTIIDQSQLPEKLNKKHRVLQICYKKLQIHKQQIITVPFQSYTFIKKFIRFQDFILLQLSNKILQFFWQSDTITLKQNKYIKWKISHLQGQSIINSNQLPNDIVIYVDQIKRFLETQSQKRKNNSQWKNKCYKNIIERDNNLALSAKQIIIRSDNIEY